MYSEETIPSFHECSPLLGFIMSKKPKRFVILSSDKSSERNLSCFFDIIKPRRGEHSWKEGILSSEYIFNRILNNTDKDIFDNSY